MDLSLDSGRDRRPTRYMVPARYGRNNLIVSDPGPSTSTRGAAMPRNKSRQAGKRPWRVALTPKEKIDAINRVHNGESKAAVARDIGVPESTFRGWCKAKDKILSQANNLKTSAATLPGTSLAGFEHVLTSSSDNSNNRAVGDSSSRSTLTTQATMLGLPSTSGVTERAEEFKAGPAYKRLKYENNSAGITMANNMSTSIRAPIVSHTMYNNMAPSDAKATALATLLNSIVKSDNQRHAMANMVANTVVDMSFTTNMLEQHQQQLQQQTNNTLLNRNKRKHSASGIASTMDVPKPSMRIQNDQLPNIEKSFGSVSQNYEITIPSTSSSDPVIPQSKPIRNVKKPLKKRRTFDAVNNNNIDDDMDNETARKNPDTMVPPGCNETVEYCTKLLVW
ncbi:Protein distal antenna [Acromyrmex echinatior]|uniref:Protein distal antenna n=1 Tax=Acromyrmex echinatior TaxID=103372 RepID=F4X2A7_ACREC|nr:Protein distal antenna [Acromyrmex echinatior]